MIRSMCVKERQIRLLVINNLELYIFQIFEIFIGWRFSYTQTIQLYNLVHNLMIS